MGFALIQIDTRSRRNYLRPCITKSLIFPEKECGKDKTKMTKVKVLL